MADTKESIQGRLGEVAYDAPEGSLTERVCWDASDFIHKQDAEVQRLLALLEDVLDEYDTLGECYAGSLEAVNKYYWAAETREETKERLKKWRAAITQEAQR